MNFQELGVSKDILRALDEVQYTTPTPIQEQAIPAVIEGKDIMACAQTGTGKTAAFSLPILHKMGRPHKGERRPVRALILTPTRELAVQIYENICQYGKYTGRISTVIYGGVSQVPQVNALRRGVDVLVATPGRLWDLMQQGVLHIGDVEYFILDEADRMLDMGFINDVRRIIPFLPADRQTMLFSATMPQEIVTLAQTILTDPVSISVAPSAKPIETIEQGVYFVGKTEKRNMLQILLKSRDIPQTLVFTRTKHGADRVTKELNRNGISALAIHGDKSQNARQNALKMFKDYKIAVLVATDIAARGIDIDDLPLVVNFDLPNEPETYVHRIGRTGRRGLSGTALSFCDESELPYLSDIERTTGANIPELTPPEGLERNEVIAAGRFVDGNRPKHINRTQKRASTPKPVHAKQEAPRRAPKNSQRPAKVEKPVEARPTKLDNNGNPIQERKNRYGKTRNDRGNRAGERTNEVRNSEACETRPTRTAETAPRTEARKPQTNRNEGARKPQAGNRSQASNRPQGGNRGNGNRRMGNGRYREDANEPRVDVVTRRDDQQLTDTTAARIRAKIEAKLAERKTAGSEITKAPANRAGSSRARRARQK